MVRHLGGVVDFPGVYLMGAPFLRRRKSALIDGVGDDARDLSNHLALALADERSWRNKQKSDLCPVSARDL
jgi:putative flavoprotein involved in K+ transport